MEPITPIIGIETLPAWLCWLFPLVGALFSPILAKIHPKVRDYGAVFFSFLSFLMAAMLIPLLFNIELLPKWEILPWIDLEGLPVLSKIEMGVLIDPLSIIMANVIAFISLLIMIYSLGYMKGDPSLTRYWFFMNFFIGSMILLVMSENLILTLFGWEGVGLCSYALIGFWYKDSKKDYIERWVGEPPEAYPPSHCGMKAFITTRIGDLSLLLGALIIVAFTGTLSYIGLLEEVQHLPHESMWILVPAAIFFFGGPIGKSAQLPLMEWLPDAMSGPTTVSALIHAATMVNAGVYLVGRIFPIIYVGSTVYPEMISFFYVIAWIGVLTAFVAGTQAMASNEIKKVLAYSTVSQLGYMMLALGVAGTTLEFALGYTAGVFHLMSHAVFKAALFLTAGAVIHAVESRFLHHMGGIRKEMPITFWCMSLTAFSLMGVPILFSGFWSKDMILESTLLAGQPLIFILAAVTVAITCFYSVRMIALTFLGKKSDRIHEMEDGGHHVHEAPKVMWIPYAILAAVTLAFGIGSIFPYNGIGIWLEHTFEGYLSKFIEIEHHLSPVSISATEAALPQELAVLMTIVSSLTMLLVGTWIAYRLYVKRTVDPVKLVGSRSALKSMWTFLFRRWYINAFFYKVFIYPTISISRWALKHIEESGIDKFNYVVADAVKSFCSRFRRTHTGVLNYNVIGMILGFILLIILMFVALVW
ncbi:MAG: NADH-quinone oxidoreductase subunit L [Candidatus Methylarchaceae archaeon HK01B]|nr:NADH-quinone oxidoreductase subunit L [Candidatus Methylarchaceae archaeon HK02M1]MCP8319074.1 NADH-quinone oxidoreductase subunit L [Candidatus Methylarchaceae archaeon HK01B]